MVNLGFIYVFVIHMNIKWWENKRWERKGLTVFFLPHSSFFFPHLPSHYPVLASVVVSDLKSKESKETDGDGCLWYLSELSSWVKVRKKPPLICFPAPTVLSFVHQPGCLFSFFFFLHEMSRVRQQHYRLCSFPSEIFGQLWLNVCIAEVVTLTSCLIPGPLSLIDGQSKHCRLQSSGSVRECVPLWINMYGSHEFKAVLRTAIVYNFFLMSVFFFFAGYSLCLGKSYFFRFNHPEEASRMKSMLPPKSPVSALAYNTGECAHPSGDDLWQTCSLTFEPPLNTPFLCSSLFSL